MPETTPVRVMPENYWREVWHEHCPKRGPMRRGSETFTLSDGSELRRYTCLGCGVECFAGLDANRYVVTRQYPSGEPWPSPRPSPTPDGGTGRFRPKRVICPTCGGAGDEARPLDGNCPAAWAHVYLRAAVRDEPAAGTPDAGLIHAIEAVVRTARWHAENEMQDHDDAVLLQRDCDLIEAHAAKLRASRL